MTKCLLTSSLQITMWFGGFVIKHGVFNFQEDPKGYGAVCVCVCVCVCACNVYLVLCGVWRGKGWIQTF